MNEWQILVIDDETGRANDRTDTYRLLEKETIDGRPLQVTFTKSLTDAKARIQRKHFHIALIDVVLEYWGDKNGEGFEMLLKAAAERMPVAIVSSQWDDTSVPYVRRALTNNADCDVRLLLRWRDLEHQETRNLVVLQMQKEIYRLHGYEALTRSGSDAVRILHLSDLHFGSDKCTLAGAELNRVVDTIRLKWGDGPDFIVVTGDIASTGHPSEYTSAIEWFQKLAERLEWDIPSRRFLLVPGNHDFSIPLAAARRIGLGNKKKLNLDATIDPKCLGLAAFAMTPFQAFAEELTGRSDIWRHAPFGHWMETAYRHQGVVFSGFNTSRPVVTSPFPQRWIEEKDITDVDDALKNIDETDSTPPLHVTLAHHSPVRSDADQPIDNSVAFRRHLVETRAIPHLIFHGHEHKRDIRLYDGKTLVVAAPTPTQREKNRPPDNARGFTMVELARVGFSVNGSSVFSYILDADCWNLTEPKCYTYASGAGFSEVKCAR